MKSISKYNPNDMTTNQGQPMVQCKGCASNYLDYCLETPNSKPERCLLSPLAKMKAAQVKP
jgi:hypothetical protein